MQELFSLGELYASDFLKADEHPRSPPIEMKLMLTEDGNVRLEKSAPLNSMFGRYFYRSSTNNSMRNELQDIVHSIIKVKKLKPVDIWCDIACFLKDNFINTTRGNVNIKDIKRGDMVLGHDNQYHEVIKLYKRKHNGNFIELKLRGLNTEIKMTDNHPLLTQRGWIKASELNKDDMVSLRAGISNNLIQDIDLYQMAKKYHKHKITSMNKYFFTSSSHGLKHKLPKKVKIDNDFLKVLGYYIGEGSGCGGAGLQFAFNQSEMDKAQHIAYYFATRFNIATEIYSVKNSKGIVARLHSRVLSSIFKQLFGYRAKNKKIPHEIIKNKYLPSLLHSLWFTDGHLTMHKRKTKYRKNYVFSSVSKNFILDLWNALECLGIISSIQHVKNNRGFSKKDGYIYRLTIERIDSIKILEKLFSGTIKKTKTSDRFVKIREINKTIENNTVYNFEVKDSNSYVCNGITSHNCNDGTLLSFVPKDCIRIGIDPAEQSYVQEAQLHADVIVQDYFSYQAYQSTTLKDQKASVITSIAMFYDLEGPISFIRDIDRVLDDNGLWVLQLSYTPLMLEQLAFDNLCHEHIYYYSLFNLKALLNANGFQIMDCQLNDTNGGSFRIYAMKNNADIKTFATQPYRDVCNFRINSLLEYEKTLKLDQKETWVRFYDRINALKEQTVSFIKKAKSEGKVIWGYGGSTKFNTLLQYFRLDQSLIDGIAERTPYKYGLRTIGSDIPIVSEEKMRKIQPDYLILGPWQFVSEFKIREKEYLDAGGKFIVIMPRFEIIGKE